MQSMKDADSKSHKSKRRLRMIAVSLTAVVFLSCMGSLSFAKYISDSASSHLAEAQDFYVSSNYLKRESAGAAYTLFDWKDGIPIHFCNYRNEVQITSGTISWQVTVTGGTAEHTAGTIPAGLQADGARAGQTSVIQITPDAGSTQVTVHLTTTSPYEVNYSATFYLQEPGNEVFCEKTDFAGSSYVDVKIQAGEDRTIPIQWDPALVAPDNTNSYMKSWTGGTAQLTVQANSCYILRFFKSSIAADYSAGQILLNAGDGITIP
ncbi:hypothetical protein [Anaerolentibacter hominis]|uniref:hypothetical protein n=1 Tax=Anaerolentibacter hominis TaxID=3079009 RepID=UPI0031B81938